MKEIIANLNNWLGVIGFVMTMATLFMTLNIRRRIEQTLGKQRFLQQREEVLGAFRDLRAQSYKIVDREEETTFLHNLRAITLRLEHFKIWSFSERVPIHSLTKRLTKILSPPSFWYRMRREMEVKKMAKRGCGMKANYDRQVASANELVMRIDEIVAIVESHADI